MPKRQAGTYFVLDKAWLLECIREMPARFGVLQYLQAKRNYKYNRGAMYGELKDVLGCANRTLETVLKDLLDQGRIVQFGEHYFADASDASEFDERQRRAQDVAQRSAQRVAQGSAQTSAQGSAQKQAENPDQDENRPPPKEVKELKELKEDIKREEGEVTVLEPDDEKPPPPPQKKSEAKTFISQLLGDAANHPQVQTGLELWYSRYGPDRLRELLGQCQAQTADPWLFLWIDVLNGKKAPPGERKDFPGAGPPGGPDAAAETRAIREAQRRTALKLEWQTYLATPESWTRMETERLLDDAEALYGAEGRAQHEAELAARGVATPASQGASP